MFFSYAARPLIPCESSLAAGISAFPAGRFVLYRDAKDPGTSTDTIKYLNKTYTRDMERESGNWWCWVRGSQVIYTNGKPVAGSPVYDQNKNRTGYYVDSVDIDPNSEHFTDYETAVGVWNSVLIKNNLVSKRKRTEKLNLTTDEGTQVTNHRQMYWVRMVGKFNAKTTGTYTFGINIGKGTSVLKVNHTSAIVSTNNQSSGQQTLFSIFCRQGVYDLDFMYKHLTSTDYYGFYTLYVKRPGETVFTELRLDDLTAEGLH